MCLAVWSLSGRTPCLSRGIVRARVYGDPLGEVLLPEYASAVERLFDGEYEGSEIVAALPRDPREMFQPAFLVGFGAGRPSWLLRRLRENDLADFTPRGPVRA